MAFRLLAIWCLMSVAIGATAQTHEDSIIAERKFVARIGNALEKAFPRSIVGDFIDRGTPRIIANKQPGRIIMPGHSRLDPSRPNQYTYYGHYKATNGDSAKLTVYFNPKEEAISFDITKDFEELDIEGAEHGIRGNQRFVQKDGSNSYDGPFTALFIGRFTFPYNRRFPDREGGCWGPDQFITTTTYTAYDVSKHFLDVQSIYILIQGDPELMDKIIEKIDFAVLNELIAK
jgi:hypothetical protein